MSPRSTQQRGKMMKAIDAIPRTDRRFLRAAGLASAVMLEIAPLLDDLRNDPDARVDRYIYDKLIRLLMTEGVEILTDHDRAAAGLSPRGPDGWTNEEIVALEGARIDAISKPITIVIPATKP